MDNAVMTFPFADALQHSAAYPTIVTLHIVGFAMLVGAVAVFDLRVLGFGKGIPVRALAKLCLPWAVLSLVLVVPTGLLMFIAYSAPLLGSGEFLVKLILLVLAAILAILFHNGPYGSVDAWNVNATAPVAARLLCAASLINWVAVIFLGRMLTY
jgi:hypothetical protein